MTDSDKSCTIASVKEEAQLQNDDSTSFNTTTSTVNLSDDADDAPPSPKNAKKGLIYLLDDVVSSKTQDDDVALLSDTERKKLKLKGKSRNYLAFEIKSTVLDNPLVWWRDKLWFRKV